MTRAQIADQAIGLLYGVGLAVVVAVATALATADPDDILKSAFWVATGSVAARSVGTAVLTFLGIKIPGISGGRDDSPGPS
jgi:hypothetical protein